MSVIVTVQMTGDPKRFEETLGSAPEPMRIVDRAKEHGLIAHRFYGSDEDGRIIVIDEWPDAESFRSFFEGSQAEIGPMIESAGVTSEPQATIWRKLDTKDDYGWES